MSPARRTMTLSAYALLIACGAVASGCAGRPSLLPNSDPALRKSSAQFAADAARRQFDPSTPAAGPANGRAQVGYGMDKIELVNLGTEDWHNVELWANRKYVVFIPYVQAGTRRVETVNFQMLYDDKGHYFPVDNSKPQNMVRQLEIVRDGSLYTVPFAQAD